jgi:hypothetical protein
MSISCWPANGLATVQLDRADTAGLAGAYRHECEVTLGGGAVHTVFIGTMEIAKSAI